MLKRLREIYDKPFYQMTKEEFFGYANIYEETKSVLKGDVKQLDGKIFILKDKVYGNLIYCSKEIKLKDIGETQDYLDYDVVADKMSLDDLDLIKVSALRDSKGDPDINGKYSLWDGHYRKVALEEQGIEKTIAWVAVYEEYEHVSEIEEALEQGLEVPQEVLNEYPGLTVQSESFDYKDYYKKEVKLKEIMNEVILGYVEGDVPLIKNPSQKEIQKILRDHPPEEYDSEFKFFIDTSNADLYIWDGALGHSISHGQMIQVMGKSFFKMINGRHQVEKDEVDYNYISPIDLEKAQELYKKSGYEKLFNYTNKTRKEETEEDSMVYLTYGKSQLESFDYKDLNRIQDEKSKSEREVFYTPWGVEVIKNPTRNDYRMFQNRLKKEYPHAVADEPAFRTTYDPDVNTYIWSSMDSTHAGIEGYLEKEVGQKEFSQHYRDALAWAEAKHVTYITKEYVQKAFDDFKKRYLDIVMSDEEFKKAFIKRTPEFRNFHSQLESVGNILRLNNLIDYYLEARS